MTHSNDCNCNANCCQPPKKNNWTKIVFAIIIVAAFSIVVYKLVFNHTVAVSKDSAVIANDTIVHQGCDTLKTPCKTHHPGCCSHKH